jgi:pimeloyl-ACP methyl ester carboxylesterase
MRKLIAAIATAVLAAGLAPDASAAGTAPAHPGARAYMPPPISWGPCTDETLVELGAECGTLVVPRNYNRPRGATIGLAVSRLVHTTSRYQGVMLTNFGGPGGSGLIGPILKLFVPNQAGDSYDWIGFDPRGVGSSTPALSCDASWFHGDRPPYRPTTRAIYRQWIARSKAYARDCAQSPDQALFRHVKTTDTVKDMESLRRALGQTRINYYGFSYGTYLGQVYATQHPSRVRRFVWDGTMDPQRAYYKSNQDQDRAFQKTFDIYFRWLAKYHDVYDVGDTYSEVRRTFLATQAKLDQRAEQGILGGDELLDVFTSAGYYVFDWVAIAEAYSTYLHSGDASALIASYQDANPTTPGADNGYAMYLGTQCTDAPWPRNQARLDADNWRLDRTYNYFTWANAWFNGPCAYWKYDARRAVHVRGSRVHVPILMIGETFDAATPFHGSLVVRRLFPTASLIEGKNGSTHAGSLFGVACTDNSIAAYLADGTVPTRLRGTRSDKICPPNPQPDPTSTTQRRARPDEGLRQALQSALEQAQLHR